MTQEANTSSPAAATDSVTESKPDNFIVSLVKMLLNINFLKWGVRKDF